MQALARRGAKLAFHDPFVEAVTVDGRRLARTELTARAVARADVVALLTPHSGYDLDWLVARARLLFDARNAIRAGRSPNHVRL
jgi:UDP-N-acetyl-D-glucosamine dehydrogenase